MIRTSDTSSENNTRNNNNKDIKEGTNRNQMIKNDKHNSKQKRNKYSKGSDMKINNSQLNCDIEGYHRTTPFLTKPNLHSKGITRYNTYNDMKEGTTSKKK